MLNLLPLLLAKAGAATITTKVVVAGAVSAAALGTAGVTGVGPVAELLPNDSSSVTVPAERSGEDALSEIATVPEREGSAPGEGLDRASEVAADEAQLALEAARIAAETAAADAQKAAAAARLVADQKSAEQARAAGGATEERVQPVQPVQPVQTSPSRTVVDQPVVATRPEAGAGAGTGAADGADRGRN